MRVEGIDRVEKAIERLKGNYPLKLISVVVGFTQRYAIFVHEDMEAKHPVGQAKFLESPARRLGGEIGNIIGEAVAHRISILKALLLGGLRLQREAQLLCPVDTSALKASAFTVAEENLEEKSQEMFERSEALRLAKTAKRKERKAGGKK